MRWAIMLLFVGGLATTAHSQASWMPWTKQDQEKKDKPTQKKEPAKVPAAPAKTPTPEQKAEKAEPKKDTPSGPVDSQADLAFWDSVKDRGKPEELRAYLKQFPNGRFADLARLRLQEGEGTQGANA